MINPSHIERFESAWNSKEPAAAIHILAESLCDEGFHRLMSIYSSNTSTESVMKTIRDMTSSRTQWTGSGVDLGQKEAAYFQMGLQTTRSVVTKAFHLSTHHCPASCIAPSHTKT